MARCLGCVSTQHRDWDTGHTLELNELSPDVRKGDHCQTAEESTRVSKRKAEKGPEGTRKDHPPCLIQSLTDEKTLCVMGLLKKKHKKLGRGGRWK